MLLVQILDAHGYASVEAETAEDAIGVALRDPPDVILVDHHLGGASGAELVREVRAANSDLLRTVHIVGL